MKVRPRGVLPWANLQPASARLRLRSRALARLVLVKNRDQSSTYTANFDWLKEANSAVLINHCLSGSNH
jgi:hypothetical protein